MRPWLCLGLAAWLLSPGVARAVSADTVDADSAVLEKVGQDERGPGPAESLRREEARRAEAEKKVEAIRRLPPERVQDWIEDKLSESELERLADEPRAQTQDAVLAVPRARLNRLLLVSAAVLALAFLYGAQRRRARLEAVKRAGR